MGWWSMWKWWLLTWSSALAETWREPLRILDLRFTPSQTASIPSIRYTQRFNENRIATFYDLTTTLGGAHSLLILAAPGGSLFMADRALFGGSWLVRGMQVQCSSVLATKTMPFHDLSLENPYLGLKIGSPRVLHFIISCMEFGPFPYPEILVD